MYLGRPKDGNACTCSAGKNSFLCAVLGFLTMWRPKADSSTSRCWKAEVPWSWSSQDSEDVCIKDEASQSCSTSVRCTSMVSWRSLCLRHIGSTATTQLCIASPGSGTSLTCALYLDVYNFSRHVHLFVVIGSPKLKH